LLALLLAAVLVPESADVVLSVEDASGLQALLRKAGTLAPSLAPDAVGATLRDRLGVDVLAESPAWGLAQRGARTVAFSNHAMGLSAPVRDAGAAKRTLASWLGQGPRRAGRADQVGQIGALARAHPHRRRHRGRRRHCQRPAQVYRLLR